MRVPSKAGTTKELACGSLVDGDARSSYQTKDGESK